MKKIKNTTRNPKLLKDVVVVIRSVNERTESVCKQLLESEVGKNSVFIVHKSPFSLALKKSYEIGIEKGRKWTAVIDADVLIRSKALADLVIRAEGLPSSVFTIQSEMLDKFFGGIRVGGVKIYRTKLLPKATKLIPDVGVRPETYVIRKMHNQGYYVDISDIVCGLHDFEQYYSDIFRKGFTHGKKHALLTDLLVPYWQRLSKKDKDFEVLLAGFKLGSSHKDTLMLDKNETTKQFNDYAKQTHLKEKPLPKDRLTTKTVDSFINNFVPPKEFAKVKAMIDSWGRPQIPENLLKRSAITFFKGRLSLMDRKD